MLTLYRSCEEATRWTVDTLAAANLQVVTSFDLRVARASHTDCACPHHGTAACDCQIVVLLVYDANGGPVTLVLHERDGRTYMSLADTPEQRPSPKLAATIFAALSLDALAHDERAQDLLQIP